MLKKINEIFLLYILPSIVMFCIQILNVYVNNLQITSWNLIAIQIASISIIFGCAAGLIVKKFQNDTRRTIELHKANEMAEREKRINLEKEYELKKKQKIIDESTIQREQLNRKLGDAFTTQSHLANVISGINHEVSPWIGGIKNIVSRLQNTYKKSIAGETITRSGEHLIANLPTEIVEAAKTIDKFDQMLKALDYITNLLQTLSTDVKRLQQYSHVKNSVKDTVISWVSLILMDRFIKDLICGNNIRIDTKSLDFVATHSPLHLSQVILNLAKNSIEHNQDMLDTLHITMYGDPVLKKLYYEDNGRGIPENKILEIFNSGITTKENTNSQHGLGLYLCSDYCDQMGAKIEAVAKKERGTKFVISFDTKDTSSGFRVVNQVPTKSIIKRRRIV